MVGRRTFRMLTYSQLSSIKVKAVIRPKTRREVNIRVHQIVCIKVNWQEEEYTYKRNIEAYSCNHCGGIIGRRITHSEWVSVAIIIEHAKRVCRIILLSAAYATARLLRSWVRIPSGTWMSVCCECRVLSGRGLCDELITRPEESCRLWCVVECDLETSRKRRPWPTGGCRPKSKQTNKQTTWL